MEKEKRPWKHAVLLLPLPGIFRLELEIVSLEGLTLVLACSFGGTIENLLDFLVKCSVEVSTDL